MVVEPGFPNVSQGFAPQPLPTPPADLRGLAVATDSLATREIHLAGVWRDLVRGRCRVVEDFFSETRCLLVLAPTRGKDPIEGRRLDILEAVLCGQRQKNIALDLDLAASTVALNARLALESLGVSGKPSRMHPLLMLAARAACESMHLVARYSAVATADAELSIVSLPRPDRVLDRTLPSAELAVIRALIEGSSYEEIAAARRTSTRTVANQISAVFRRLHVSGRNELVQRLCFADEHLGRFEPERRTLPPPPADDEAPASSTRQSA
jgi:DNA-binding NarL/FixJ family response regulator